MTQETYYSDRVTTWYVSPSEEDELVVNEVTLEPVSREYECVDFSTLAWCPDQESADRIALALRVLDRFEEWRDADEFGMTALELAGALGNIIDRAEIEAAERRQSDAASRHPCEGTSEDSDGTDGQDRKGYGDNQDRESYYVG